MCETEKDADAEKLQHFLGYSLETCVLCSFTPHFVSPALVPAHLHSPFSVSFQVAHLLKTSSCSKQAGARRPKPIPTRTFRRLAHPFLEISLFLCVRKGPREGRRLEGRKDAGPAWKESFRGFSVSQKRELLTGAEPEVVTAACCKRKLDIPSPK